MKRKLQQAGSEIVTSEAELRKAKERIHMLEDKVLCPSKFRRPLIVIKMKRKKKTLIAM